MQKSKTKDILFPLPVGLTALGVVVFFVSGVWVLALTAPKPPDERARIAAYVEVRDCVVVQAGQNRETVYRCLDGAGTELVPESVIRRAVKTQS